MQAILTYIPIGILIFINLSTNCAIKKRNDTAHFHALN